jgi:hypothetical protein
MLSRGDPAAPGNGEKNKGPAAPPMYFQPGGPLERVPKVEDFVLLDRKVLRAILAIAKTLKEAGASWALAGDACEVIQGVNTKARSIQLVAFDKRSAEVVLHKLTGMGAPDLGQQSLTLKETTIERRAEIGGESHALTVESLYAAFQIEGITTEIHGSPRIRIGDWGWGDPIEFEPASCFVVGEKVPIMPLRLRSDLYFGLGWMDRVNLIQDANHRRHHQ